MGGDIKILLVPTENISNVWEIAEMYLEEAIPEGEDPEEINHVKSLCEKEFYQLWLVCQDDDIIGSFVTCIEQVINGNKCCVIYLGGDDLLEWINAALSTLEKWAKNFNCKVIQAVGRKAWARVCDVQEIGILYERKIP